MTFIIKFEEIKNLAEKTNVANKRFFKKLKLKIPSNLDQTMQKLHEKVFEEIDCLKCANCCKILGPKLTDKDIERLSRYLKIKPSDFFENYLRIDEDNDYVFKVMPCPFLLTENYCSVYKVRPKACKEYPHTDRKKFYQLFDLTLKNSYTCPAVYLIIEKLKSLKF
jgi:hypothetical protein